LVLLSAGFEFFLESVCVMIIEDVLFRECIISPLLQAAAAKSFTPENSQ
jgi:hypothetical protein